MNKVSAKIDCALCNEEKSSLLRKGVRHDPSLSVRRCEGCGLTRLDPLPTYEQLAKFYTEAYRAEHEPGISPAQAYRTELPEARVRVQRLKSLLGPEMSLLEIGSSSGAFLDSIRPFVKKPAGIEPARLHREWAAERLKLELFAELGQTDGRRFDRIVLFHVLEHVRRPIEFLKGLLGRLAPRGLLAVEVPNVNDALLSLYQVPAYAPFYYQDAHLWYFSKETLARAAIAAGAKAEVIGLQRYDLSNHLRWMLTGKPGGLGFYDELLSPSLNAAYGEALVRAGYCDTLWALMRPISPSKKK